MPNAPASGLFQPVPCRASQPGVPLLFEKLSEKAGSYSRTGICILVLVIKGDTSIKDREGIERWERRL